MNAITQPVYRSPILMLIAIITAIAMVAAVACGGAEDVAPASAPAAQQQVVAPTQVVTSQQAAASTESSTQQKSAGTSKESKPEIKDAPELDKTGWPETVRLGLIPTEANIMPRWQPVVEHLEETLGVEVEPFVGTDYTATIIAAKNEKLDVVWLGPKSYVKARSQGANLQPVVKWINEDTNIAGYNSLLITPKDSGINTIEDAEGRTFAFNDPESTSGFLVPTVFFLERNIEPDTYFSEVFFAGSHEATALAVANGKVDLASNNNETLPRLIETGKVAEDDVRVIWESPLIPTDPISVQASLPDSFRDAVRQAFLDFNDPQALDELQIRGWIPASDDDYNVIRTLEETKSKLAATQAQNPEELDKTGWPEMVRLGLIPTEANILPRWQPIVEHLEQTLGVEVEPFVGTDYTATIIAAKNEKLDVVWLGPKSYVKARSQGANLEPVVKWINEDTGIAGYNSLLITPKDSGINTIEDAEGRTFAFNDPESTSGFLVPTVFFLEREIEPDTYFSEVFFAGSHEATALAVANGKVDLASNNNETLPRLIETGKIDEGDVRIIWESPLIPTDPISVQAGFPDSFKEAVRQAFLAFDDPEAMDELQIKGWIPASDEDYNVIRTLEETKAKLAAK